MTGRFVPVAVLAILVALALPSASRTSPEDAAISHTHTFFAPCPGGPNCIDLDVSQGDTPDPIPAGDALTYKITLRNHGPDTASDVTVTDTLPPDVTFVDVSTNVDAPDNPACNEDGGTIFCFFGTVENTDLNPSPGPRVITVFVSPNVSDPPPTSNFYPETITNTVATNADCFCFDRNTDNNRSLENTTVTSPGDLRITKTHPPDDPVPPSATLVYQLKLENIATHATLNPSATVPDPITVTDTLPHGFQYIGTEDPENTGVDNQCSATSASSTQNSIVTCHPQTSISGENEGTPGVYTIYLEVNPTTTGTYTNQANVSKYGGDVTPGNNSASDLTHVACPKPGTKRIPALCVTKTDSQDPVPEGKPFNYTITVINERTGTEDDFTDPVKVTDQLPPGMTVQSTAVQGGSCDPVSGGVLTCTITGGIPHNGTRTVTVTLIALQVGTFENVACIEVFERLTCGSQTTTIIGAADLMITKTGTPDPVQVNSDITYTIKVTNKGPANVDNVQMNDSIPANTTFISSDPADPACSLSTPDNLHCNLGTMNANTSRVVTVVLRPTAPGIITNTAKVANDGTPQAPVDFDLTNNTATFTISAIDADLAITKVAAPSPVGIGQPLTYTIQVTNKGPGVAAAAVVTDHLPSAVSSPDATSSQGTCSGTTTITCKIGDMNPAAVVTITIQVTPSQPGTATNTASVDSDSFDPDTSNNSASATVTITAADVMITKSASPDPVAFGTTLTYTLVVKNNGPNRATGVTVRDTLPDGVALPTATTSQGTCFGSPTVTCAIGDLNTNLSATITIVVTPLVQSGTVTNTASVSSAFDLNSSNNTATVTTNVISPRLEMTPDLGAPGFVPFVLGSDFPPNAPVELTWSPGLGKATVTAAPDGTFRVSMLVFPNDTVGPRQLVATSLQPQVAATNFLATNTNFLVLPPTSQPFQVQPQVPITKLVQRSG